MAEMQCKLLHVVSLTLVNFSFEPVILFFPLNICVPVTELLISYDLTEKASFTLFVMVIYFERDTRDTPVNYSKQALLHLDTFL